MKGNVGQYGIGVKVAFREDDLKAEQNETEFQENEYFELNGTRTYCIASYKIRKLHSQQS